MSFSSSSFSSSPVICIDIIDPCSAARVSNPIIEFPGTTKFPLVTSTLDLKLSTIDANFAEALACKPLLLIILSFTFLVILPYPKIINKNQLIISLCFKRIL